MRFMHPGPEYAGYNDPLHLIRVTNYLQPLGKEKALAIIDEYCRIHEPGLDETWLFLVLRTLFEVPQPPGYMPRMKIGAMARRHQKIGYASRGSRSSSSMTFPSLCFAM